MEHLLIEGFIGSGKGAVGRALARRRKLVYVDLDRKVADRMKMPSSEVYEKFGEPFYRAAEGLALEDLTKNVNEEVIVLGSGAVMLPSTQALLKQMGTVVYIKKDVSELLKGMKKSKNHSWIESENYDSNVKKIYKEREPSYEKTADITIKADGMKTTQIVDAICAALDGGNPAPEEAAD